MCDSFVCYSQFVCQSYLSLVQICFLFKNSSLVKIHFLTHTDSARDTHANTIWLPVMAAVCKLKREGLKRTLIDSSRSSLSPLLRLHLLFCMSGLLSSHSPEEHREFRRGFVSSCELHMWHQSMTHNPQLNSPSLSRTTLFAPNALSTSIQPQWRDAFTNGGAEMRMRGRL